MAAAQELVNQGYGIDWTVLSQYPALSLSAEAPLAGLLADLSGQEPLAAVSFGTEGGLYQAAGVPAIICGPGDIARAHRPDEYAETGELAACLRMIERLAVRLRA